jgi:hypothetical protein
MGSCPHAPLWSHLFEHKNHMIYLFGQDENRVKMFFSPCRHVCAVFDSQVLDDMMAGSIDVWLPSFYENWRKKMAAMNEESYDVITRVASCFTWLALCGASGDAWHPGDASCICLHALLDRSRWNALEATS